MKDSIFYIFSEEQSELLIVDIEDRNDKLVRLKGGLAKELYAYLESNIDIIDLSKDALALVRKLSSFDFVETDLSFQKIIEMNSDELEIVDLKSEDELSAYGDNSKDFMIDISKHFLS